MISRRQFLSGIGLTALAGGFMFPTGPAAAMTEISFAQWQPWTFRGIPRTRFGLGGAQLSINAQGSSSVVYGVVPQGARSARSASWQWQVSQGVGPTDLAARGGDDRAIALYFVFVDGTTAARFGDRTPSMSRLMGMRNGRTLIYVWGGRAARGTIIDSPYLAGRGKTVVLRGAGTAGWTVERVDLASDFQRAFGTTKDTLIALGVSSDSDDTAATNVAAVRNLVLT